MPHQKLTENMNITLGNEIESIIKIFVNIT